ncbi:MAG: polyprenyl synthetase family protein [Deltaproteobacteria bacterium]|nr:polyprenyl synthetase family protein [Deltaproteobacteria bacterium]
MESALALIEAELKNVELQFKKDLESDVHLIRKVGEYVLSSGGKRIRPALLLLSAKLCGYEGTRHISIASVIEFIHTATLLHDDVVDDASLRRGLVSANKLWGNEASVLVGDYLFSKSFSIMVEDGDLDILRVISGATTRIAEGEVLQLASMSDLDMTETRYIEVVKSKTAVLLATACQAGAILGKAYGVRETALHDFGMDLGTAFQLIDDTLDYVSNEEQFGKSIGHDLKEGKVTLPLIHTLKQCSPSERQEIADVILSDTLEDEDFRKIIALVRAYGGIEYTLRTAGEYVAMGKSRLAQFPDSPGKSALLSLADYVITRSH